MPKRKGHKGGKPPFRSKVQWRFFFANPKLRRYAKKWAHETPGGPIVRYRRLPDRKNLRHKVR